MLDTGQNAMAVSEGVRSKKPNKTNVFEWTFSIIPDGQHSPSFTFCGYCCFLYCKAVHIRNPNCTQTLKSFRVGLNGYPAPFRENISSFYSMRMVDKIGFQWLYKKGTVETSEEIIDIVLLDVKQIYEYYQYRTVTLFFSWSEDGGCCSSDHDVKIKPGSSEQGTQTEAVSTSSTRDIYTETENLSVLECGTRAKAVQHPSVRDTCTNKDKDHDKFLESLSKDLACFYESKVNPDCVLKIGEVRLPVHRSVLSARSSVFAAMFLHDTSESRSGEVDILDVDANALNDIIFFVYTGTIRGLSPDTAAAMYIVADKYALIDLRDECLDFLKYNLTVENVGDAALLAHTHAETELEEQVVKFIEEKLEEHMQSDSWVTFSKSNPLLANKLLCSALMASKAGKI